MKIGRLILIISIFEKMRFFLVGPIFSSPPAMKLTQACNNSCFLVNIHRLYAFYKISKMALTIFLYARRIVIWIALEKVTGPVF